MEAQMNSHQDRVSAYESIVIRLEDNSVINQIEQLIKQSFENKEAHKRFVHSQIDMLQKTLILV